MKTIDNLIWKITDKEKKIALILGRLVQHKIKKNEKSNNYS